MKQNAPLFTAIGLMILGAGLFVWALLPMLYAIWIWIVTPSEDVQGALALLLHLEVSALQVIADTSAGELFAGMLLFLAGLWCLMLTIKSATEGQLEMDLTPAQDGALSAALKARALSSGIGGSQSPGRES